MIEANKLQSAIVGPAMMYGAPGPRNRISTRANNERASQDAVCGGLNEAWVQRHYRTAGMEVRTRWQRNTGPSFRATWVTTKNSECSSSARIQAKAFGLGCTFGMYL